MDNQYVKLDENATKKNVDKSMLYKNTVSSLLSTYLMSKKQIFLFIISGLHKIFETV